MTVDVRPIPTGSRDMKTIPTFAMRTISEVTTEGLTQFCIEFALRNNLKSDTSDGNPMKEGTIPEARRHKDLTQYAVKELYRVLYFAQTKRGIEKKNLPEIQFTNGSVQKVQQIGPPR
jgi:hypothetical protein